MKTGNGDRANIGLFRTTAEAHYYKGTVPFQCPVLPLNIQELMILGFLSSVTTRAL